MKTLYYNGLIYTGTLPLKEAFVVEDNYFTFVGTSEEALQKDYDQKVDLKGAFVTSGFIDSHMHVINFGNALSMAPLHKNTHSLEAFKNCLKNQKPNSNGWIMGRGWNQDYFSDAKRMPTRFDLDEVSKEHPVLATRACGHALVVNTKALELLKITKDTPQVEGGQIVMDEEGPNGIFFDNAMDIVLDEIPAIGKEDVKKMLKNAFKALNSYGITSCHSDDFLAFHNLEKQTVIDAYKELEAANEMTVRIYEQSNFSKLEDLKDFINAGNRTGEGSAYFKIGPLKMLGDGALGARTAYLSHPYHDDPSTKGLSIFTPDEFNELIGYAHKHDMQCAVHCIGDACLDLVLNAYEKAFHEHKNDDLRHGIVHCQITRPEQLKRIQELGLHVYAQTIFLDYDLHMVKDRVGEEFANSSYNFKTLQKMGVTVSNGSDCPVELPNVLGGMQCAITRSDLKGVGPYLKEEAFTVEEAIHSFTKMGAYASFEEDIKGQIKEGYLADFVLLDQNLFEIDPSHFNDVQVLQTYMDGKCVYQKEN